MLSKLALELNSLSIHLTRHARVADAQLGVPPARLSALSVLVFGGDRTMGQLAAAELVTQATMSRIVDGLEASGLAARRRNPEDARSWVVRATPKGRRLMERGRAARAERMAAVLAAVPPADRPAVEQALKALRRALTEVSS
ncbi:MAG TPA: MarR family transcriptional regulator [Acidimicrobiales bacterium]|nr:MarR family transcriptional regulator [Acidimicrobiales bacterium]